MQIQISWLLHYLLIWIYTLCKGRIYLGSAGQGLKLPPDLTYVLHFDNLFFCNNYLNRKHQDWFDENDEEIKGLLEEKHQKHKAYLSDTSLVSNKAAYSNICKTVQTRLRDMQDSWLSSKADEIQSFPDRKDMKKFFDAVYGPQSRGTTPLLSADGTSLLTYKEAILKRWAEHFDSVLNRPSSVNDH